MTTVPLTLGELQEELGYPKWSLHMLLQTLVERGWVQTGGRGTTYAIGVHALLAGTSYLDRDPVVRAAAPVLAARPDGADLVPDRPIALSANGPTNRDEILAELDHARAQGYATEREQTGPGLGCIAVALTYNDPVTDALSCSIPLARLDETHSEAHNQDTVRRGPPHRRRTAHRRHSVTERILITGAAGDMAALMRPRLARPGRVLRLLDIAEIGDAGTGEEVIAASVTDPDAMATAMQDVSAVIHLGGHSLERPWAQILEVNIHGTYVVLEAARGAGVGRVILASSNHAVGFHPREDDAPDHLFPRPDTFYGVSKVTMEAIGSLYHDRYGLDVIAIRIGSCFERPTDTRMLSTWLSPGDGARLLEACLSVPSPGFRIIWGVSDNKRRWFSLDEARNLGFAPHDDAEAFAAELIAEEGEPDPGRPPHDRVGGGWVLPELDVDRLVQQGKISDQSPYPPNDHPGGLNPRPGPGLTLS